MASRYFELASSSVVSRASSIKRRVCKQSAGNPHLMAPDVLEQQGRTFVAHIRGFAQVGCQFMFRRYFIPDPNEASAALEVLEKVTHVLERHCFYLLLRPVFHLYPEAGTYMGEVIPDCQVLGAAVVPECHRMGFPAEPDMEIGIFDLLVQEFEYVSALALAQFIDVAGETRG